MTTMAALLEHSLQPRADRAAARQAEKLAELAQEPIRMTPADVLRFRCWLDEARPGDRYEYFVGERLSPRSALAKEVAKAVQSKRVIPTQRRGRQLGVLSGVQISQLTSHGQKGGARAPRMTLRDISPSNRAYYERHYLVTRSRNK